MFFFFITEKNYILFHCAILSCVTFTLQKGMSYSISMTFDLVPVSSPTSKVDSGDEVAIPRIVRL